MYICTILTVSECLSFMCHMTWVCHLSSQRDPKTKKKLILKIHFQGGIAWMEFSTIASFILWGYILVVCPSLSAGALLPLFLQLMLKHDDCIQLQKQSRNPQASYWLCLLVTMYVVLHNIMIFKAIVLYMIWQHIWSTTGVWDKHTGHVISSEFNFVEVINVINLKTPCGK